MKCYSASSPARPSAESAYPMIELTHGPPKAKRQRTDLNRYATPPTVAIVDQRFASGKLRDPANGRDSGPTPHAAIVVHPVDICKTTNGCVWTNYLCWRVSCPSCTHIQLQLLVCMSGGIELECSQHINATIGLARSHLEMDWNKTSCHRSRKWKGSTAADLSS